MKETIYFRVPVEIEYDEEKYKKDALRCANEFLEKRYITGGFYSAGSLKGEIINNDELEKLKKENQELIEGIFATKIVEILERQMLAYRKLAAHWAQMAQIECGEGLDPGFNHCLDVVDEQVKKKLEREQIK
jgi:hypothetical protein